jgi:GTP-binding protein EngB required for normal cell division
MRRGLLRRRATDLGARLHALERALHIAEGRLDRDDVARAAAVHDRALERLGFGTHHTVVALAGSTGSGKSSLFNALAGESLSQVGVRRPTTGAVAACVWGEEDADVLLDWVGAARRHRLTRSEVALDGLVLLDLPDYDSIEVAHRAEVDRIVELVDLFVWVVDPQKYADAALHAGYLRPLATHEEVMLVVLNQIDRLEASERQRCCTDLKRLLHEDGLGSVSVVATSVTTEEGLPELRSALRDRVSARRAAIERFSADLDRIADVLGSSCGQPRSGLLGRSEWDSVVAALAGAAGVEDVAAAVGRSHVHRSVAATGWPLTRWLRRFRADPLRRLGLGASGIGGRTSLAGPTPLQQAAIDSALRGMTDSSTRGLIAPWPGLVRARLAEQRDGLADQLDRAVAAAEVGASRPPLWWKLVGGLQYLLLAAAVAGFLWLALLFGLSYLRLPEPSTPKVGEIPIPTALLLGGLAAGLLLAILSRVVARIGAARRKRVARRRLLDQIRSVAEERVRAPVQEELNAHDELCAAVGDMR